MTVSDYSYCLGIEQALINLAGKFKEISGSSSSSIEEKIEADSHANDINHVLTYVFPMAAKRFREEEKDIRVVQETILGVATIVPQHPSSTEDVLELATSMIDASSETNNVAGPHSAIAELDSTYEKVYAKKIFSVFFESKYSSGSLEYLLEGLKWVYGQGNFQHSQGVVERLCQKFGGDGSGSVGNSRTQFVEDFDKLVAVLTIAKGNNTSSSLEALRSVYRFREAGNNLMVNKSYPQAIQVYTEGFKAAQVFQAAVHQIPQLLTNRAIAYIGMSCFPEAVADLNLAVSYDSNFTTGWTQLAYCHLYMGSLMLSLRCYLKALKSYVAYDEKDPAKREAVARSLMPQFVQRLLESIQLCEKRARQQRLPSLQINSIVASVQEVVRSLDAFSTEDKRFYDLDYNVSSSSSEIRRLAERNNRLHPSILNSDAQQDLLVNSSIEATAIPMSIETVIPRPATQPIGGRTGEADPFQPAAASLSRVEQFMNRMSSNLQNTNSVSNLGVNSLNSPINRNVTSTTTHTTPAGNVIRISTSSGGAQSAPGPAPTPASGPTSVPTSGPASGPTVPTPAAPATPQAQGSGPNYSEIISGIASAIDSINANTGGNAGRGGVINNVLHNLLPDYVSQGLESLIGNGARVVVNGEELSSAENRPNATGSAGDATNSRSAESSTLDDTDMPEVDLD